MNIFFDVDYTIISMDGRLRPHTDDVFRDLVNLGHYVYIWSGVGKRDKEVEKLGLKQYVSGVFVKPIIEFEIGLERFAVTPRPDFVIDDHKEIVEFFGGVHMMPYYFKDSDDIGMLNLYKAIIEYVEFGFSNHPGFKAISKFT